MKKIIAILTLLVLATAANATHFGRGFAFQRTTFFAPSYGYAVGGYAVPAFVPSYGIQQTYQEPLVQALPGVQYAPSFFPAYAPAFGFAPSYGVGFAPAYAVGYGGFVRSFAFSRSFHHHRAFFGNVHRGFGLGGRFLNVGINRGIGFNRSFVNVNINRGIGFSRGFGRGFR